jgi:hypothetical protein
MLPDVAAQPPIVAQAEMCEMLGLTRKRVSTLANGPGFPTPLATLSVGRIWRYDDVKTWAERTGRTVYPITLR